MVRKITLAIALALGVSPFAVQALGLGEIKLKSALNQYLSADIQLLSVDEADFEDIRVSLAPLEAFNRVGVERPFQLTKLQFKPLQLPDGSGVIRVSSKEPIREPFLNFLVEVNWPKGKLVREYTVLLDPPVTLARKPAPVQTPSTGTVESTAVSGRVDGGRPAAPSSTAARVTGGAKGEYGPTRRNDTVWSIAKRVRHEGVSMHQMMMALYNSNPEAFIKNNINNLKIGQIIRVPARDDVLSLSQREAVSSYSRQLQEWQADRKPTQTAGKTETTEQAAKTTETVEKTPAKDELKIATARPEGSGQAGASEGDEPAKVVERLRQDLLIAEEAKAGAEQESGELKSRVADLESQLNDLQRLLELKNDQLAQMQAAVAGADQAAAPSEESEVAAETGEMAAEDEPTPEIVGTSDDTGATADAAAPDSDTGETPETTETSDESGTMGDTIELAPEAETLADTADGTEQAVMDETRDMGEKMAPAESMDEATESATTEAETDTPAVAETPKEQATPKPVAAQPVKAERPGLFKTILGDTTYLGLIIGGILFVLAMLWVWVSKRRSDSADFQESILVSTIDDDEDQDQVASPDAASQQTDETSFLSDFSPSDIDALQDETGEVDPLAEADVYIAYGRYQQAEELVRQAIEKDPERLELKHKLAEILFATKDQKAFQALADEMHDAGVEEQDPGLWAKITNMGAQLLPGAALFAGAAAVGGGADNDSAEGVLDLDSSLSDEFNLDELEEVMVSDETVQMDKDELDFDVDLGLNEHENRLNEDTSSIEALGDDLGGLTAETENSEIDLGLNLDEETTALDLDDAEKLETVLDEELDGTGLDEGADLNFNPEQAENDLGAFEEPTSEVVELKIGDPLEDAEVADLANENNLDFGDLGDLDVDLSNFQESEEGQADVEVVIADDSGEADSALEEDSYSLDDLNLEEGADSDLDLAGEAAVEEDEISTKIDLARAYVDMGDPEGARDILSEVMDEGNDVQKSMAQEILGSLS